MNAKDTPLVSVLMTAYNREKYIAEAIDSVLASTYTNFELIISDDGSIDNTVTIAKRYESEDRRIKVYVNERNLGQFPNRNKASEHARGKYIMNVDSDDKIFSNGISDLVEIMESFPDSSFGMFTKQYDTLTVLTSATAIRTHFFKQPFLVHGPGATILKRDFFNTIGKYPVDYGIPGDMYFNLKACCYTTIVLFPFEFMYYRLHDGQELNNSYDYLYNNYKYLHNALSNLPLGLDKGEINWLSKKNKRRFSVNICKYFVSTFDIKMTKIAVQKAGFTFRDALEGIFH